MSPLERAARAACAEIGDNPDRLITAEDDAHVGLGFREPHVAWTRYVGLARAVLTAVREPSEPMLAAGEDAIDHYAPGTAVAAVWKDMIDSALDADGASGTLATIHR